MKKRIFALLLCCTLLVVAAAFFITASIFYDSMRTELQEDLRSEAHIMATAMEERGTTVEDFAPLSAPNTRITLIAEDGEVLYDNQLNDLTDHSDRPEFEEALRTGAGEASRKSETLLKQQYYYAVRLQDGSVLRLSRESGVFAVLLNSATGALLPLFFVAMVVVCLALSIMFTRWMIKPLSASVRDLDFAVMGEESGSAMRYPEFEPFRQRILFQKQQVKKFISELHEEKRKITDIIGSMQEGFILLDGERSILLINDSARHILRAGTEIGNGHDVVEVLRFPELLDAIRRSVKGGSSTYDQEIGGRNYRFFVSPAESGGVLIFIVDVTELKKAEDIRRDFAANVSHELKTPLTSINGFSEMLETGMISAPEEIQKMAGIIHSEASRLIELVCDIIRISEIENLKNAELTPVDLHEIAENALQMIAPEAENRAIKIEKQLAGSAVMKGDRTMLFEVFYNLLDNAVKYNHRGGCVQFSLRSVPQLSLIHI